MAVGVGEVLMSGAKDSLGVFLAADQSGAKTKRVQYTPNIYHKANFHQSDFARNHSTPAWLI
jgi:hypothetical protein